MSRVSLLLADRAPTRLGIRMALGDDFSICAEADDAEQAIRLAKRLQPDVCLVGRDVAGHGLASVRGICRAAPACAVVVLSEVRDVEDMLDAVRAGAVGYMPGPLDGERLRRIVDAVVSGEAVVPRTMVHELLLELRAGGAGVDALTGRESQVLGMLRRGQTTAAIAERLQITPVTVRRHISELVRKLGVADRSELMNRDTWGQDRPGGEGRLMVAGAGNART
jgi:DNA-binding NarL/FixJ family response regulator